jgi:penicillin-binding protein 1A
MVQVRVDPTRGTETKSRSGILEMVNEEYRDALLGPEPIKVASGASKKKSDATRRAAAAPRVMDELF